MSADDKFMAGFFAAALLVIVGLVVLVAVLLDQSERRNDRLQELCITSGGNWSYGGCDMKPVVIAADTDDYITDYANEVAGRTYLYDARRLVVIDPEDRAQVERLRIALKTHYCNGDGDFGVSAALREFAQPQPVKPEEPTGLGAVVEDDRGDRWVLSRACSLGLLGVRWENARTLAHYAYSSIAAVRVLSEGVTDV